MAKRKMMMLFLAAALLTGCGTAASDADTQGENPTATTAPVDETEETQPTPEAEPTEGAEEPIAEEVLPGEYPMDFLFASGASSWGTLLKLNADGTFTASYTDSDNDAEDEYPKGTCYICNFSGKFTDIEQLDETSYKMTLDELTLEYTVGEEWIEDGVRYIASEAQGIEGGTEFIFYTPQTPLEGLSEEFLSWWHYNYLRDENSLETLEPCYGIYNTALEIGFFAE